MSECTTVACVNEMNQTNIVNSRTQKSTSAHNLYSEEINIALENPDDTALIQNHNVIVATRDAQYKNMKRQENKCQ